MKIIMYIIQIPVWMRRTQGCMIVLSTCVPLMNYKWINQFELPSVTPVNSNWSNLSEMGREKIANKSERDDKRSIPIDEGRLHSSRSERKRENKQLLR